jgi:gamma-glutamyl-gamma-aminobutyrate hydrolase PuuD
VVPVTQPEEMTEFDSALVIWGGADISPELYNHPTSRRTSAYAKRRDEVEWALIQEAISMELPIIGVCRGAQMLCAAAGGYLLQDVRNHAGPHHAVYTADGKEFYTNSIHHQMMVPNDVEHEMVAWTKSSIGAPYLYKDDKTFEPGPEMEWVEPEFVYFSKIDGYAIQWHPEAMGLPESGYELHSGLFPREAEDCSCETCVGCWQGGV